MARSQDSRLVRQEPATAPTYLKARGRETTRHARCATPVLVPGSTFPMPCGDRVVRAGRCAEHFLDWKQAKESRRGGEARNPKRGLKRASGLSGRQWVRRRKATRRDAKAVA